MFKNYIITAIVCLLVGAIIASGFWYFIYTGSGKKYQDRIVKLENINSELDSQLKSANDSIEKLTDTNNQLTKGITDSQGIAEKIRTGIDRIDKIIEAGSIQK